MAKNNANGVDEMLDMLYEMIDDAKAIPFSNDCRLDRNGALDLLDSIRNRFPVELNESIKIVQQREDYLARAQKEAQRVLEQAQAQAQRMVDEQEIVRQARAAAEEAVRTAKAKATEILTKATDDAKAVSDEAVYARLRSDSNAARKRTGCSAWRKAKLHADTTKSAPAAAPPKNKYAMINDPYKAPRVEFDRVFRHYPTK